MLTMLVRNKVENYSKWKAVFDSQDSKSREAGLYLLDLWQDYEDFNNVFFTFRVENIERAKAFLNDPQSAKAGKEAGVIEGEFYFLNRADDS